MPSSGGPPLPFPTGMLNVPADGGPGPDFGRQIRKPDLRGMRGHTGARIGDWTITSNVILEAWDKQLPYHMYLHEGHMVWHHVLPRSLKNGRVGAYMMSHFAFNDICRRGWRIALAHLEPLLATVSRDERASLAHVDARVDRRGFLAYLSKPEASWAPLFDSKSMLNQAQDAYITLPWLACQGVLSKFTPVGTVASEPQPQYAPMQQPRVGSRMQMALGHEGVFEVANIWGARAQQGSHLFEIVKRVRDRRTGDYAEFASVPYANTDRTVPERELRYRGVSGAPETGVAFYRGRVMEVLGAPPGPDELELMQGRRGTVEEARDACSHGPKLKIMLASAARMS